MVDHAAIFSDFFVIAAALATVALVFTERASRSLCWKVWCLGCPFFWLSIFTQLAGKQRAIDLAGGEAFLAIGACVAFSAATMLLLKGRAGTQGQQAYAFIPVRGTAKREFSADKPSNLRERAFYRATLHRFMNWNAVSPNASKDVQSQCAGTEVQPLLAA